MAAIKILLIEDDEIDQRMIISKLSGFDILCAHTIDEATERISTDSFDIVLLDLNLPDSAGIHTYLMIRKLAKDIPIMVLSGMDQDQLARKAIQLGAQDFVSKDRMPDQKRFCDTIVFAIQRSKLAVELKKAEALTREQSEFKSNFLAQFSHEIRTPLNAVIGMAHLMESHVEGEAEELLSNLQIGANRLLSIVDDILDISKIESGEIGISPDVVNLRDVIEGVVKIYGNQTAAKGIFLVAKISPDVPQKIKTDPKRLCQVLSNLISNAVKFTGEGSILVSVEYLRNQLLRFKVIDSGFGMSKQESSKLFKPFVQVGKLAGKQGTGLGLSICKKIVEAMGGEISVDSQPGVGTTFVFTISALEPCEVNYTHRFSFAGKKVGLFDVPGTLEKIIAEFMQMRGIETELCNTENQLSTYAAVIRSKPPKQREGNEVSKRKLYLVNNNDAHNNSIYQVQFPLLQSELYAQLARCLGEESQDLSHKPHSFHDFSDLRILVADDDKLNRLVIKKLLSKYSVQLRVVNDGRAVIEAWQADRDFDLVLMDCSMPVLDGFQATAKLRELGCIIPIIALTAHAFDNHRKTCDAAGMNGSLTKPIKVAELEKILRDLHKRKKSNNEHASQITSLK